MRNKLKIFRSNDFKCIFKKGYKYKIISVK